MSSSAVISVKGLSKCYSIYKQPQDRLKQFIFPKIQFLLGFTSKSYSKNFWALKHLSFDIGRGETVAIIGRNGSGKSTLLQMIAGTLNPTSGVVEVQGRVAALLELGSGFNPEFTGRENINLYASILGLNPKDISERYEKILDFADIGDFINQPLKTYSSGMMMRLAFAVIAHVDAEVLIIDEALSVGDAVFVKKCNLFLQKFIENGTLIFVSHSMTSVLELCDRAIWVQSGEMIMDGDAKEVVRNYNAYVHQQINKNVNIQVKKVSDAKSLNKISRSNEPKQAFKANIFNFDFSTPFWGAGGAEITDIGLFDADGNPLEGIVGPTQLTIRIFCRSKQSLEHPIIGFSLRNIRGIEIIGENTSLGYLTVPPGPIPMDTNFIGEFSFFLPYLAPGEYFLGGAVADLPVGSQTHVQHHRRDDALRILVTSSHVVYGVFSMPIDHCAIVIN